MSTSNQLNLADQFFHPELRKTRTADFLAKIDSVIANLIGSLFEQVNQQLEAKGLFVRKGSMKLLHFCRQWVKS